MENKDNRSRDKRHKMKTHYRNKSKYCTNNITSSSSGQIDNTRGIVNIVDSSDEQYVRPQRSEWGKSKGSVGRITSGDSSSGSKQQQQQQSKPRRVSTPRDYPPIIPDMDSEENEQMHAGDFKIMSEFPTSMGSHFKFSSEKQWEEAETEEFLDKTEASEYFTLNLKLLNAGLQTIPFYKRMDYMASLFTKQQLENMEQEAEAAEKIYQIILKEHLENPKIKINSASHRSVGSGSAKSQKTVASKEKDDDLDELLQMTTDQIANVELQTSSQDIPASPEANTEDVGNKNDIQEWLDNVLEE